MTVVSVILCIIAALILLLSAFIFIPMDIGVEYIIKEKEKRAYFRLKLFNIFPFKLRIKSKGKKVQNELEEGVKVSLEKFLNFASDAVHTYKYIKGDIKEIVSDITKKLTFKEIDFDVYFGTENAAKTGIMTGAVSAAGNLLVSVIDNIFGVKSFSVNVTPCFEKEFFNVYFKGILKLRLVNIMIIIYKIIMLINKFKEKSTINKEKAVL